MRALIAIVALALICAEATAQTVLLAERDVARPGGVYTTLSVADPTACAQLCAEDGICMAWTFRAGACELKAVVPSPIAETGAISGLSSRAPDFARRIARAASTPVDLTPLPATETEIAHAEGVPASFLGDDEELLGGPLDAETLALRPRL